MHIKTFTDIISFRINLKSFGKRLCKYFNKRTLVQWFIILQVWFIRGFLTEIHLNVQVKYIVHNKIRILYCTQ